MATCLACGADTFDLADLGEVRSAGPRRRAMIACPARSRGQLLVVDVVCTRRLAIGVHRLNRLRRVARMRWLVCEGRPTNREDGDRHRDRRTPFCGSPYRHRQMVPAVAIRVKPTTQRGPAVVTSMSSPHDRVALPMFAPMLASTQPPTAGAEWARREIGRLVEAENGGLEAGPRAAPPPLTR